MNKDKVILGTSIFVFLALYTAAVFTFFEAESTSRTLYLLLASAPPALALLIFPRAALVVLAIIVYSFRWLYDWLEILPREATWLSDFLIVVLVLRTVLVMIYRREPLTKVEKVVLWLLAFAAFTALANSVPKNAVLAGVRLGFRYILLFVAALHLNVTKRWLKGYMIFLFAVGLVQLPVMLGQFSQIGWQNPDAITGTFGRGGTTGMGLFLIVLVTYLAARTLEEAKVHLSHLVLLGLLSIPPILGEIKFYFLFIPVLVVIMARRALWRRPGTVIGLVLLSGVLIFGADYFVRASGAWSVGRSPLAIVSNIPGLLRREMETAEAGRYDRVFKYRKAISLIWERPRAAFIGHGTGAVTDSYAFNTSGRTLMEFTEWDMTSMSASGVIWLFLEYGLVGLCLFGYLLWLIFRRAHVLLASNDMEERIWGRTLEVLTAAYAIWNVYGGAWQLDSISFAFWPLAAMLVKLSYQVEARTRSVPAMAKDHSASEALPAPMPAG